MMQFLKSILSKDKKKTDSEKLEQALIRIQYLEGRIEMMSKTIIEISKCTADVTIATKALAQDTGMLAMAIAEIAVPTETKKDNLTWFTDDDDPDGYLN